MDIETIASLIAFAAMLVVWIAAPAGVEQPAETMAAAPSKA